jgi:hypothetical protein
MYAAEEQKVVEYEEKEDEEEEEEETAGEQPTIVYDEWFLKLQPAMQAAVVEFLTVVNEDGSKPTIRFVATKHGVTYSLVHK